jgi:hypothetical protein
MEKRMPHLIQLYEYNNDGTINDLDRSFKWKNYNAFEMDLFVCDMAKYEAVNGSLLFL